MPWSCPGIYPSARVADASAHIPRAVGDGLSLSELVCFGLTAAATGRENGRVARIKIAYIGGGPTRAAGTMAGFVSQGDNFAGSEVVLVALDAERLELTRGLAERMARARSVDLTVTATTDR